MHHNNLGTRNRKDFTSLLLLWYIPVRRGKVGRGQSLPDEKVLCLMTLLGGNLCHHLVPFSKGSWQEHRGFLGCWPRYLTPVILHRLYFVPGMHSLLIPTFRIPTFLENPIEAPPSSWTFFSPSSLFHQNYPIFIYIRQYLVNSCSFLVPLPPHKHLNRVSWKS